MVALYPLHISDNDGRILPRIRQLLKLVRQPLQILSSLELTLSFTPIMSGLVQVGFCCKTCSDQARVNTSALQDSAAERGRVEAFPP